MVVIVLIKSLSTIATKRPAFYGRILPVLLGLDPSNSAVKAGRVSGVHHAFLSCLKCTHPGAAPWRDRLVGSLREMKAGGLAEALQQVSRGNSSTAQDVKPSIEVCDAVHLPAVRKRPEVKDDDVPVKRAKPTPNLNDDVSSSSKAKGNVDNGPVQQLVAMFSSLVAQGEQSAAMLEILFSSISADLPAQVVMANMPNLPLVRPKQEGDVELLKTGSQDNNLSAYLTNMLSRSTTTENTHSALETHMDEKPELEGEPPVAKDAVLPQSAAKDSVLPHSAMEQDLIPSVSLVTADIPSIMSVSLAIPCEDTNIGELENGIPGLDSSTRDDDMPDIQVDPAMISVDLEENSQEQITKLGTSSMDLVPSMSEELSPNSKSSYGRSKQHQLLNRNFCSVYT